jgi:hypothetical protein
MHVSLDASIQPQNGCQSHSMDGCKAIEDARYWRGKLLCALNMYPVIKVDINDSKDEESDAEMDIALMS